MTIERITPTEAEAATINELMNAKFPVTVSSIAGKLGMTEIEAARRLPADRVSFVTGDMNERFDNLWAALAAWEKATLFITHEGHVFEIAAKLSTGKRAMGYYNILEGRCRRRPPRLRKDQGRRLRHDALHGPRIALRPFLRRRRARELLGLRGPRKPPDHRIGEDRLLCRPRKVLRLIFCRE